LIVCSGYDSFFDSSGAEEPIHFTLLKSESDGVGL
jgi:hypothetical protein